MSTPRIVSLLPAGTELVCALGHGANLAGRSHECDHPPWITALPVCSKPRLDPAASAADIDKSVKSLLRQGLGVFEVDTQRIEETGADIIVTQTQCEVCAVSEDQLRTAAADYLGASLRIVSLSAADLAGLAEDIKVLGGALDASAAADELNNAMRASFSAIADAAAGRARSTVVCLEWTSPLMTAGNWMPEIIDLAGGQALLADAGRPSQWTHWSSIRAANPDVILISPCGFTLERAAASARDLARLPGWSDMRAVRERRVFALEGHHLFNRPGPRLVDSARALAEVLHGEPERTAGPNWRRL